MNTKQVEVNSKKCHVDTFTKHEKSVTTWFDFVLPCGHAISWDIPVKPVACPYCGAKVE